VWLGEHLWDEGIVVELLDLPYLSFHLEVLGTGLVDVRKKVLVFEIHSIVFSIVVLGWVVGRRFGHVMLKVGVVQVLQVLDDLLDWVH